VLQHNSLFPHYTVEQNIAVVPRLLKWDRNRIRERTEALLEMVHLPGGKFLHKYPGQLSGGQQQRVNLARALAADPPILLMDEPFGALDAITRASISKDFSGIQEFMRKTVIMVTHDIQEAFMIGDHICLMSKGRIVQMGKPEELLFNPANDFVRDFFAASYLRLALGLIKIKDVWGELEGIQAEPSIIFEADVSLWSAMEMTVRNNELTTIDILNTEGQSKSVTKATLFSAFSGVTVSNAGI
jgi:osmoprotectant transport system ATP-binding protein